MYTGEDRDLFDCSSTHVLTVNNH